jgi:hypothetical protein
VNENYMGPYVFVFLLMDVLVSVFILPWSPFYLMHLFITNPLFFWYIFLVVCLLGGFGYNYLLMGFSYLLMDVLVSVFILPWSPLL